MSTLWTLALPTAQFSSGWSYIEVKGDKNHSATELDLSVLATSGSSDAAESDQRFRIKLKQSRIVDYLENGQVDEDQWSDMLRYVLLGELSARRDDDFYTNLTSRCNYDEEDEDLVITIQRTYQVDAASDERVGVNIGKFELAKMGKTVRDANPITAASVIQASTKIAADTGSKTRKLEAQVERLQRQLLEIVEAKREYEDQMLHRFALVLNTKKAKINQLLGQPNVSRQNKRKLEQIGDDAGPGNATEPGDTGSDDPEPKRGVKNEEGIRDETTDADTDDEDGS